MVVVVLEQELAEGAMCSQEAPVVVIVQDCWRSRVAV